MSGKRKGQIGTRKSSSGCEKTTTRKTLCVEDFTFVEKMITRPKPNLRELRLLVEDMLWTKTQRRRSKG